MTEPDLLTVQDVIEEALAHMGFHRVYLITGSRTDKHVNAYRHPCIIDVEDPADVASSDEKIYTCSTFKKSLNNKLKDSEVSVAEVFFVKEKFINKFAVKQKIYEYVIHAGLGDDKDNIFLRINNCLTLADHIDFEGLQAAAKWA